MDKKGNLKQAVYEVFGVGGGAEGGAHHKAAPAAAEGKKAETAHAPAAPAAPVTPPKAVASYLGPGTVLEGTLRSVGDVEIAGSFKGDIVTEGTVRLRSDIESNITAECLELSGCALVGDVVAKGTVTVSEGAKIRGSVTAGDLLCAGEISGDLNVSGNTVLEEKARVDGKVQTGTLAVVRGALIRGAVEMKGSAERPAKQQG